MLTTVRAETETLLEWAWDYIGGTRVSPILDQQVELPKRSAGKDSDPALPWSLRSSGFSAPRTGSLLSSARSEMVSFLQSRSLFRLKLVSMGVSSRETPPSTMRYSLRIGASQTSTPESRTFPRLIEPARTAPYSKFGESCRCDASSSSGDRTERAGYQTSPA